MNPENENLEWYYSYINQVSIITKLVKKRIILAWRCGDVNLLKISWENAVLILMLHVPPSLFQSFVSYKVNSPVVQPWPMLYMVMMHFKPNNLTKLIPSIYRNGNVLLENWKEKFSHILNLNSFFCPNGNKFYKDFIFYCKCQQQISKNPWKKNKHLIKYILVKVSFNFTNNAVVRTLKLHIKFCSWW